MGVNKHQAFAFGGLFFLFIILIIGFGYLGISPTPSAAEGADSSLEGYAWSDNIGWIDFGTQGSPRITINSLGVLSGYAWSSNAGWIRFFGGNNNTTGFGPAADGPSARLSGNNLIGWARACSVYQGPDCAFGSAVRSGAELGGWDGWVKMSGSWNNGVHTNGNHLEGFAWGNEVIGWVDFCPNISTGACVQFGGAQLTASCYPYNAQASSEEAVSSVSPGTPIVWHGEADGGSGQYSYCWGTGCDPDLAGRVDGTTQNVPPSTSNPSYVTYNTDGTYRGEIEVRDSATNNTAQGSCTLVVSDSTEDEYNLNVTVTADTGIIGASVGAQPWGFNCTVSNSPCDATYELNTEVHLTATSLPLISGGYPTITWTEGGVEVCGSGGSCTVTMYGPRNITVHFSTSSNPPGGGATTITGPAPTVVRISQQSDGIPTSSAPDAVYQIGGGDPANGGPAPVCVKSVKSKVNNSPIEADVSRCFLFTVDTNGEPQYVQEGECNSDTNGTNGSPPCFDLDAPGDIHMVVTVEDLDWTTLVNSPYEVTLETENGCSNPNPPAVASANTCNSDLEFRYQPPNVEPE